MIERGPICSHQIVSDFSFLYEIFLDRCKDIFKKYIYIYIYIYFFFFWSLGSILLSASYIILSLNIGFVANIQAEDYLEVVDESGEKRAKKRAPLIRVTPVTFELEAFILPSSSLR